MNLYRIDFRWRLDRQAQLSPSISRVYASGALGYN